MHPIRLESILQSRHLALDSMIFIYEFQQAQKYGEITRQILRRIVDGEISGTASTLVISELLVLPYAQENPSGARELRQQITGIPNLRLLSVGPEIADQAAKLRARLKLRLADCVHLASAQGADYFVTNDRRFERVKEPKIAILDDVQK